MNAPDYPVRVRYRSGVVGEAKRVVHIAMSLPGGDFLGLCELRLAGADAELISDLLGMPCMACTRLLAMRSRVQDSAGFAGPREVGG
ncbi:hypothetical protein [Saccharopolyspora sp. SCSIO 74807]|uniref:hypothetical protein n=1 Tax=Saccharopolyspora sp. SCSIO 74807 TaxID=3118084 RepID=UPI0030CD54AD